MNNEYTLTEVIKLASIGEQVLLNELNKQSLTKKAKEKDNGGTVRDWAQEYKDLQKEDNKAAWLDPLKTTGSATAGLGLGSLIAKIRNKNKYMKLLSALGGAGILGGVQAGFNAKQRAERKDDLEKLKELDKYQKIKAYL